MHITNRWGAKKILKEGLNPEISGYVTKWKYVNDILDPNDFSTILYKQKLWNDPNILNRFNSGSYLLKINPSTTPHFRLFTNISNGMPQWLYKGDVINKSYIDLIRVIY